jgi:hypothetical protein
VRTPDEVRVSAAGSADADRVWHLLATPACWPAWSWQIRHVEDDGGGTAPARLAAGLALRLRTPVPGVVVPVRILDVRDADEEACRSWTMEACLPGGRVRSSHELVATTDRTVVTVALRWLGPRPIGALVLAGYRPAAALAVHRLLSLAASDAGQPTAPDPAASSSATSAGSSGR